MPRELKLGRSPLGDEPGTKSHRLSEVTAPSKMGIALTLHTVAISDHCKRTMDTCSAMSQLCFVHERREDCGHGKRLPRRRRLAAGLVGASPQPVGERTRRLRRVRRQSRDFQGNAIPASPRAGECHHRHVGTSSGQSGYRCLEPVRTNPSWRQTRHRIFRLQLQGSGGVRGQ